MKLFITKRSLISAEMLTKAYYHLFTKIYRIPAINKGPLEVERATTAMLQHGEMKKNRKIRMTRHVLSAGRLPKEGEVADISYYLDEIRIDEEARYDGLYAVCTTSLMTM